jgi:thioredoxin reductase/NAD-dependent dihydropyrimidine dehydrogenase PreA subunit
MAQAPAIDLDSLRGLGIFRGLRAPALDQLFGAGILRRLPRNERLSNLTRDAAEAYWFVLDGMVAIALYANRVTEASDSSQDGLEYLGCLGPGTCFSDGYRSIGSPPSGPSIDCIAATAATLLEVDRPQLQTLMARNGSWSNELLRRIAASRQHFLSQQEPARRVVQDFFLRHGLATSSRVRVRRIDCCLDCNKCQEACAKRHGAARVVRFGPRLGRLVFPIVCRNCHDRPCVHACGFGALNFDDESGDVRIGPSCKGCGGCAQACPNGAISMVPTQHTVADFPEPIPVSDASGMSNVGGLFVAGDVSGAALIRLSINQAVRAVDAIGPRRSPPDPRIVDVAIVGAGPAGLAAALRCRERNLSCWILEKDRLASTIQDYPKNKHVMAEPSALPLLGSLWFETCTREELLARWQRIAAEQELPILEQAEVKRIQWHDPRFTLEWDQGELAAEHVLICIGKRGSPRRLGLPGETFPRVRYTLSDPDEFAGQHVLVVGGGDSAVEAALTLAEVPETRVTLSYRQAAFSRTKALNRQRLLAAEAEGTVRVELKSTVKSLEPGRVCLMTERGEQILDNHVVLAFLGADPPTAFLRQTGIQVLEPGSPEMADYARSRGLRQRAVKCDRCAGYPYRACLSACPMGGMMELDPTELFVDQGGAEQTGCPQFSEIPFIQGIGRERFGKKGHRVAAWLAAGAALLLLAGIGVEALLRRVFPEWSLMAWYARNTAQDWTVSYGPGRGFGHWLGYIGSGLMLLSLLYSLRTRVARFKNLGAKTAWLSAHLWVGFAGATLVTYHSVLKLDRWASIALYLMWAVLLTGALGRYAYGMVHSAIGVAEFELRTLERHRSALLNEHGQSSRAIRVLLGKDWVDPARRTWLIGMLWQELRDRALLGWLRVFGLSHVAGGRLRRDLVRSLSQWAMSRRDYAYLQSAKSMLTYWNIVHIVLAIVMFILAGIHVVYGFLYKAV